MMDILSRYRQEDEPIGRNSGVTVYRGYDSLGERPVAIKVLALPEGLDTSIMDRWKREMHALAALTHPSIVPVYDYGQAEGQAFVVMELVEGIDLRRYLRERSSLSVDVAISIANACALALGVAHQRGMVHGDVKLRNILIRDRQRIGFSPEIETKLTDFGMAGLRRSFPVWHLHVYTPELSRGEMASPATDVYALGSILYEMLTGHPPFEGDTPVSLSIQHIHDQPIPPREFNADIPPALEEIVLRCLSKAEVRRYSDGAELARALSDLS